MPESTSEVFVGFQVTNHRYKLNPLHLLFNVHIRTILQINTIRTNICDKVMHIKGQHLYCDERPPSQYLRLFSYSESVTNLL